MRSSDEHGAARRRRERRLRQFLRHERLTVAMVLSEKKHHTSRGQRTDRTGEGGKRDELHGDDLGDPPSPAGALPVVRQSTEAFRILSIPSLCCSLLCSHLETWCIISMSSSYLAVTSSVWVLLVEYSVFDSWRDASTDTFGTISHIFLGAVDSDPEASRSPCSCAEWRSVHSRCFSLQFLFLRRSHLEV